MSDFNNTENNQTLKKIFSILGLGFFVFLMLDFAVSKVLGIYLKSIGVTELNSWETYLASMIPLWLIGFPVCYLIVKKLPAKRPDEHEMQPFDLVKIYLALTAFMILGSVIGNIISFIIGLLAGGKLNNTTIDMINKQKLLPTLVFAVIFGPIMEELAFRKVILDRVGNYSKKYAVILSGIMFGLFHLNLFQFFYAAVLGMAFAYIYLSTGRIRYSIILHSTVNFMHGFVPIILLKKLDIKNLEDFTLGSDFSDPEFIQRALDLYSNPAFILLGMYGTLIMIFIILGIIIFFTHYKKISLDNTGAPIQKENVMPVVYINIGMILFLLGTIAISIYKIVIQLI